MKKISDKQRLNVRAAMILGIMEQNGVNRKDRIGGSITIETYARHLAIQQVADFAVVMSSQLMENKLHEFNGDQESVWRFFLEQFFPGEDPAGEEESHIITASQMEAQNVIDASAAFRERMERGKHNA